MNLSDIDRLAQHANLLPCPLCGSAAEHYAATATAHRIICPACHLETDNYDAPAAAAAHWNRRTVPARAAQVVAPDHVAADIANTIDTWEWPGTFGLAEEVYRMAVVAYLEEQAIKAQAA